MAVAFDAATVSTEWTGTTPDTETHTPVGTPRGVLIFSMNASSTDSITGASYGALSLTEVVGGTAVDTAGETGHVKAYFAGSSIPTGAQTCTVTQSGGNGVTRRFYVVTLTGSADLEVVDVDVLQENAANPGVTLDSGTRTAIRVLALHSGAPPANIDPAAGLSVDFETGFATNARTHLLGHQTTPGSGSTTLSWTIASDDVALVGVAVAEVEAANQTVTPSTASLTTTTFAPTVTASDHKTATPTTASLTLATFAPTVTATANQTVTPDTAALTIETFAPTVSTTANVTVTPGTAALSLTAFAPTVTASDHKTATPGTAALTLTAFAPTVVASDHKVVTPGTAALTLTGFAPTVTVTADKVVTPGTADLTLTAFAPTVTITDHKVVTPDPASLSLTAFAPTVTASDHQVVTPSTASLALATFAPTVSVRTPFDWAHAASTVTLSALADARVTITDPTTATVTLSEPDDATVTVSEPDAASVSISSSGSGVVTT